jgi:hypothetical protein
MPAFLNGATTLSIYDTQHNNKKCDIGQYIMLRIDLLSVIMPSIVMLCVVMLSSFILGVLMMSVVMLNVVAPF